MCECVRVCACARACLHLSVEWGLVLELQEALVDGDALGRVGSGEELVPEAFEVTAQRHNGGEHGQEPNHVQARDVKRDLGGEKR